MALFPTKWLLTIFICYYALGLGNGCLINGQITLPFSFILVAPRGFTRVVPVAVEISKTNIAYLNIRDLLT